MILKSCTVPCLILAFLLSLLYPQLVIAKSKKDYYDLLELTKENFTPEQLQKNYRRLALKFHPDKNKSADSKEKFTEITHAYEVLKDKEKKKTYDMFGEDGLNGAAGMGGGFSGAGGFGFDHAEDIFRQFFGGGFGFGGAGQRQRQRRRGHNAQLEITVSLEDIYRGKMVDVELERTVLCSGCDGLGGAKENVSECTTCNGSGTRVRYRNLGMNMVEQMVGPCDVCQGKGRTIKKPCKKCNGKRTLRETTKLKVDIEPGLPNGSIITFSGKSDEAPDQETGDLFIKIHTIPDTKYLRDGSNLYIDLHLTLVEALEGFTKKLKHMDNHIVTLSKKGTTQPEEIDVIKGEGMPKYRESKRFGDLFVRYKVVLPEKLNNADRLSIVKILNSGGKHDEL